MLRLLTPLWEQVLTEIQDDLWVKHNVTLSDNCLTNIAQYHITSH